MNRANTILLYCATTLILAGCSPKSNDRTSERRDRQHDSSSQPGTATTDYGPCQRCNGTGQITERCPSCQGKGKDDFMGGTCGMCNGTGKRDVNCPKCLMKASAVDTSRNYYSSTPKCKYCRDTKSIMERCPSCSGKGKDDFMGGTCGMCNGTGKREVNCTHCLGVD